MKNNKIVIIIIAAILIFVLGYNQSQKIENKEEKIMQAYQMLEDTHKQRIKDKSNISERSDIRKIKLKRKSNNFMGVQRYTGINKDYLGKTVYEVTFPLEDGRPETEFMTLYNLELTKIVGYGALD